MALQRFVPKSHTMPAAQSPPGSHGLPAVAVPAYQHAVVALPSGTQAAPLSQSCVKGLQPSPSKQAPALEELSSGRHELPDLQPLNPWHLGAQIRSVSHTSPLWQSAPDKHVSPAATPVVGWIAR